MRLSQKLGSRAVPPRCPGTPRRPHAALRCPRAVRARTALRRARAVPRCPRTGLWRARAARRGGQAALWRAWAAPRRAPAAMRRLCPATQPITWPMYGRRCHLRVVRQTPPPPARAIPPYPVELMPLCPAEPRPTAHPPHRSPRNSPDGRQASCPGKPLRALPPGLPPSERRAGTSAIRPTRLTSSATAAHTRCPGRCDERRGGRVHARRAHRASLVTALAQ